MVMLITHRIHVWDLQSRLNPSLQVQLVELVLATLVVVSPLLPSGSGHPTHLLFPAAAVTDDQVTKLSRMIRLLVQSKEGGGSKALKLQACNEQIDLFRLTYSTLVTSKWTRNTNGAAIPLLRLPAKATARGTGLKCLRHAAQSAQMNHTAVRTQQVSIEGWQYPRCPTLARFHHRPLCVAGKYLVGRGGFGEASCTACAQNSNSPSASPLTYIAV
jgi:hypothetical protein